MDIAFHIPTWLLWTFGIGAGVLVSGCLGAFVLLVLIGRFLGLRW